MILRYFIKDNVNTHSANIIINYKLSILQDTRETKGSTDAFQALQETVRLVEREDFLGENARIENLKGLRIYYRLAKCLENLVKFEVPGHY